MNYDYKERNGKKMKGGFGGERFKPNELQENEKKKVIRSLCVSENVYTKMNK